MLNIDFTFLFVALNLVILYLFLKKFLFGRVGQYMEARTKRIEDDMRKAGELTAEGEGFRAEQRKLRDAIATERTGILDEARTKATREADAIVADAKKESARILASAREEIEREKEQAMSSLRNEVASLALMAASKVLEQNVDNEKNRKLISEFLDKEGVA